MKPTGANILAKSWELTEERFARRNRTRTSKGRPRIYCGTPLGQRVTAEFFLKPLTDFLAGSGPENPPPAPGDLGSIVYKLNPQTLALVALAPLLDAINRGWSGDDTDSAAMLLRMKIGRYLCDRLMLEGLLLSEDEADRAKGKAVLRLLNDPKAPKRRKRMWQYLRSDWNTEYIVAAGSWLLECALSLEFPKIAPEWQEDVNHFADELLQREQVLLPHTDPPPPWTDWFAQYDNRLWKTFVRDWRPQTKAAITETFRNNPEFEHAKGINALQGVPFLIDEEMLKLTETYAVRLMGRGDDKEQLEADKRVVRSDVEVAKWLSGRQFYLTYSCDKRGRVYAIPQFNFGREDHVRSLFKFARWMPLGPEGIKWLEIHAANCQGDTSKEPWDDRLRWAQKERKTIQQIAADPFGTLHLWENADRPLCYVAACRELAGAWADPDHFTTHLPIEFDGSANGF
jgi:hypothetical protein